ncbi:MAG: hypothetical protein IPG39_12150 [Bacteroidetes bacterium]|nr:hypothetical protein [Bacteroidota bacterium]
MKKFAAAFWGRSSGRVAKPYFGRLNTNPIQLCERKLGMMLQEQWEAKGQNNLFGNFDRKQRPIGIKHIAGALQPERAATK